MALRLLHTDSLAALGIPGPCPDELQDLPPSPGGPDPRPRPAELGGTAAAGVAAPELGDRGRAGKLIRRAADAMGPDPESPGLLKEALTTLSDILAARDDAASRREAEPLAVAAAVTCPGF
jgi:hypothetical protein